jgi:acetyl-CoA acetyltransferase
MWNSEFHGLERNVAKAFKDKFAIAGLGLLAGSYPEQSMRGLQAEAARMAIADAGLDVKDVNGAIDLKLSPGSGDIPGQSDAFPRVLGMPCRMFFQIGRGGASSIFGILAASKFLELGLADYVVLAAGFHDRTRGQKARERGIVGWDTIEKQGHWGPPFGDSAAASHHSFFACRHMHEYGTTPDQFGQIAVAARQWASTNPLAHYHGRPATIEDYRESPLLVWPYRRMDVCLVSDGAVAFVMTTAERARDLARPPVSIMGAGVGEAMERLWWEKANYTRLAVDTAKQAAFGEADIEIGDVDIAGLYDCFTAEVLFQLEDYGWCEKGEGGPFVEDGHIAPGGDLPVNTFGGLLAAYYLGELSHLAEVVTQLRGDAGDRQLPDLEVGLVTGHGGEILAPGMCSTHATLVLRN